MSPRTDAQRRAGAAVLREVGEKFEGLMHLAEAEVDEMAKEFDRLRGEEREAMTSRWSGRQ